MSRLIRDSNGNVVQAMAPGASQSVATSGSSAQSAAFGTDTTVVRLMASQDVYLAFGSNPTATSTGLHLPAGVPEYFAVTAGEKVAALQVSAAGALNVVEMV